MKRRFVDALNGDRCAWTITLKDGSDAQCGRRHTDGLLCSQHKKMADQWVCDFCGGNDELPQDHCVDCSRPENKGTK